MCGRYHIDQFTKEDAERAVLEDGGQIMLSQTAEAGDVVPSDIAPVVSGSGKGLILSGMSWGFPASGKGQLLINARAETVMEKKTFSDSVLHRRCVIPAKLFYEWDRDHNKAEFTLDGQRTIYLAGFYAYLNGQNSYVIITTAANESMIQTHDRMPLMIPGEHIKDWIADDSAIRDFLRAQQPMLTKKQDYEQMRFF